MHWFTLWLILIGSFSVTVANQRAEYSVLHVDSGCSEAGGDILIDDNRTVHVSTDMKAFYACKDGKAIELFRQDRGLMDYHLIGDTLICLVAHRNRDTLTLAGKSIELRSGRVLREHGSVMIADRIHLPRLTQQDDVSVRTGDGLVVRRLFSDSVILRSELSVEPQSRFSQTGPTGPFACTARMTNQGLCYIEFADTIQKIIPLPELGGIRSACEAPSPIEVVDSMVLGFTNAQGRSMLLSRELYDSTAAPWDTLYTYEGKGEWFGVADGYAYVKYEKFMHEIKLP